LGVLYNFFSAYFDTWFFFDSDFYFLIKFRIK